MDGKFVFGSSAYEWDGQIIAVGQGQPSGGDRALIPGFSAIATSSSVLNDHLAGQFTAVSREASGAGGGVKGSLKVRLSGIPKSSYLTLGTSTTAANDVDWLRLTSAGVFQPETDDTQSLGSASFRWSVVYAGTGTINTSDFETKQDIEDLSAAEKRVAQTVKGLLKKFRFKDAVAAKGDAARIHVGVIAQDLKAAFEAEGLDAHRYAMFCSDTWYEYEGKVVDINENKKYVDGYMALSGQKVSCDENGDYPEGSVWVDVEHDTVEKTRLGVRYAELLAFILATI
jgi:hypothetical protein